MTRHEQRCENNNRLLFEIPQDLQKEFKSVESSLFTNKFDNLENRNIENNRYNFRPYNKDQSFFLMIEGGKFISENHPAAVISAIVEKLDLSTLYEQYSNEGSPAYHPKMMLKILFYAYYDGIMSCRTIWDAVIHRYDFIYLATGEVPNFRTINRFRLKHIEILPALFTQIVLLCKELDMIGFENLAIDGEKIQANTSYRNSKNLTGIEKEYDKIKEGIKKLLEKEINEYFNEEIKEKRLSELGDKLNKLEEYKELLKNMEDKTKRVNVVDTDANIMHHKDGQILPSYTHQSARDDMLGVVTAIQSTQTNDVPEDLIILVDKSVENTGDNHENILADCGFSSYEILEEIEKRVEDFYVPDKRFEESKKDESEKKKYSQEDFKKNEKDEIICPNGCIMVMKQVIENETYNITVFEGTGCGDCPKKSKCTSGNKRTINIDSRVDLRDKMREKLQTDQGREIYIKRQGLIETVHGDDQRNKKWIQHHLKCFIKASGEFALIRIATNIGLIVKYRTKEILAMG